MILFDGLPLHPMIVHAPVVLIPLVAAGLVLLLVRPSLRRPLGPILAVLAVGALVTSFAAVWSGEQLGEVLQRGSELDDHQRWGNLTRLLSVLLAAGVVAFVALDRFKPDRKSVTTAVGVVTAVVAVAAMGAVGFTGHAGAKLAWEGKALAPADAAVMDHGGTTDHSGATEAPLATTPGPPLPGEGLPGVDVVMGEWDLVTSVDSAQPGTITFRFRNMGELPHSLRIRTQDSGGDRLEWESELVGPGESGLLVADLAAGTYDLDCPVEDAAGEHDALGMQSVFTVTPDAPALAPLPGSPATVAPDAGSAGGSAGAEAAPSAVTVNIQAFAFTPAVVRVKAGGTVTWTNNDSAAHTATGTGFDTGSLARGQSGTVTFDTPGTFDYRCTPHPAMRGTVIVEP